MISAPLWHECGTHLRTKAPRVRAFTWAERFEHVAHAANHCSSTSCAATEIMAVSAASTSGGSGLHTAPFRSRNMTSDAHEARLLPSGNGWFQAAGTRVPRPCRREIDTRRLDQHGRLRAGDLFGEPEVLGQRDVAGHHARRSSSSLSRSKSSRALVANAASSRTRSTSAASDSTINASGSFRAHARRLRLVCELLRESDSGLLRHDITISHCHDPSLCQAGCRTLVISVPSIAASRAVRPDSEDATPESRETRTDLHSAECGARSSSL